VSLSGEFEASAPRDIARPDPRFWVATIFSFWALLGAACSAFLFLVSTGPVQAGYGSGIWFSAAPPEWLPAWTGLGPLGPSLFPFARLGLLSWWLALIVFPVVGRLAKVRRAPWWSSWPCAALAGTVLAVLAVFTYRLPAQAPQADESSTWNYVKMPFINWQEIAYAIGFLVLATAMRWILAAPPRRPARR
jgi:hypothetical protein